MKNREKFILITRDEKLAETLEENGTNMGIVKLVFLGSSYAVGVGGIAGITSLMVIADPEPISKTTLIMLTIIVGGYVVLLTKMLLNKKYTFRTRAKTPILVYTIEVEPASSS